MTEATTESCIYTSIIDDNIPELKKRIEEGYGEDLNDGGWTPLMAAVYSKNEEACQLLIESGVALDDRFESSDQSDYQDGDDTRCTALSLAMHCEYIDIAKILIEAGADVNTDHYTYSYEAYYGADIHDAKNCILMAMEMGDVTWRRLISNAKSFDIDSPMTGDKTSLIYAIENGKSYWVEQFLKLGADPLQFVDSVEMGEINALGFSLEKYMYDSNENRLSIVKLLFQSGGISSFSMVNGESIIDFVLETENETLIKLFRLENVVEAREEDSTDDRTSPNQHGLNPAALLPVTSSAYETPIPDDIRSLMSLLDKRMGLASVLKFLEVEEAVFFSWIEGETTIPYPAWNLMREMALSNKW